MKFWVRAFAGAHRIPASLGESKNPPSLRRQLTINLYSVSKVIGHRRFQRTIARDVTWTIEPRSKYVILSHQQAALSVFVNIIAGLSIPSEGWVKPEGKISPPGGFLRYSKGGTPPELIKLLAPLYRFDAEQVIDFVAATVQYDRLLRTPTGQLPIALRRELNLALTFAIPCDHYFFVGMPNGGRSQFRKLCQQALARRSEEAAVVVGAGSDRVARSLGPDAKAAILYRGNFTLYQRLDDALAVFERLEPESAIPNEALEDENYEDDVDLVI